MLMIRFAYVIALALPSLASAQMRLSVGAGAGVAGSTESSLSEGRGAPILMAQATRNVVPFVGLGAEVNYWRHSAGDATFVTGIVQAHLPLTGVFVKAGVGYGTGDPDERGKISGVTGQLGLGYDISIPAAPVAFTIFANGFLAHGSVRYLQMVGGGLAITFR